MIGGLWEKMIVQNLSNNRVTLKLLKKNDSVMKVVVVLPYENFNSFGEIVSSKILIVSEKNQKKEQKTNEII